MKEVKSGEMALFESITGNAHLTTANGDFISAVGHYIENLNSDSALRDMHRCCDGRGFSAFFLGGALTVVNESKWYVDYGYKSFKEFVEAELGIATSTAYDYMSIYTHLLESEAAWNQIAHIGWTKIRLFARYVTKSNIQGWIKAAEKMNATELREFSRNQAKQVANESVAPKYGPDQQQKLSTQVDTLYIPSDTSDGAQPESPAKLVEESAALNTAHFKRFRLYPEQEEVINLAIDCAKQETPTSHENVALTNICMAYLTTYKGPAIVSENIP